MRLFFCLIVLIISTKSVGAVLPFSVIELDFTGPVQGPTDAPSLDIDFWADFAHESGETLRIHGFWDGDGAGGVEGNVFRIRFCPSLPGTWTITDVFSNTPELNDLREGETFEVEESGGPGFWLVDEESHCRWFKRSDGSYPYIIGNTHYDFLGAPNGKEASRESIEFDISQNATYFNKLRFCVRGLRSENTRSSCSVLEWSEKEYVLLSDTPNDSLIVNLPDGQWAVFLFDVVNREVHNIAYSGSQVVLTLPSKACMTVVRNPVYGAVENSTFPLEYSLQQNYPNPFNSGTTITFFIPNKQKTTLAIYNVVGRRVKALVDGLQLVGVHSIQWNGLDFNGQPVSSGLYFYQLRAGNFLKTRKMLLTR